MDQSPVESSAKSHGVSRLGLMAYAIAAAVVVLDQLSKFWVLKVLNLPHRPPIEVLPFFQLSMVWNQGVSFGLFRADSELGRWLIVGFAIIVVSVLAVWAWGLQRRLTAVAVGLIIGGAVGNNLIDRVRFGAVADFLDFHKLFFPWVFNVADSAITVGVALLLLDGLMRPREEPAR